MSWVNYPFLESHPQYDLAKRQMTGGGTVVTFELEAAGTARSARSRCWTSCSIIDISNNLGDAKSLITHPATTTHRAMGPEGRAAIGLGDGGGADLGRAGRHRGPDRRPGPGAELGVGRTDAKKARRDKRRAAGTRTGFPTRCWTSGRRRRTASRVWRASTRGSPSAAGHSTTTSPTRSSSSGSIRRQAPRSATASSR